MAHNHNHHNHNHSAHASVESMNKAFLIGIVLNTLFVIIEAGYGIWVNSMALLADAGHNLSDVLGLILAWGAAHLALRLPTKDRTYGYRKSTILAALFNAIILMVAVGAIGFESVTRFFKPEPVEGLTMIYVAGIGVIINSATAFLFMKGKETDLNIKGAFIHMAADAAISLGVVVAGFIIYKTGLFWIDPVLSLFIMLIILAGTWNLLKDSFNLAMDSVPVDIEIHLVEAYLDSLPEVKCFHDLHIWAMSTTENALTVHIVKEGTSIDDNLTHKICKDLHSKFGIEHTTIQYESGNKELNCMPNSV